MQEICQSGSEGGAEQLDAPFLPYQRHRQIPAFFNQSQMRPSGRGASLFLCKYRNGI